MKANTLDLRVGDHFIHEGKEFVVTEEESIGCVAEVLEPDEEWTGEYGYLFAAEVVDRVVPSECEEVCSQGDLIVR